MQWAEWQPFYEEIVVRLEIDQKEDYRSARILQEFYKNVQIEEQIQQLYKLCQYPTIIFGAGPTLSYDLEECLKANLNSYSTLIAADGATSEFIKKNLVPQIIVTDLDGNITDIEEAAQQGSLLVVHAHGDNIDRIKNYLPKLITFKPIPSTQVEPIKPLVNFGGFTDGDRAVFMALECQSRIVALSGFNLGLMIGAASKPQYLENTIASAQKKIKLQIAAELLQELADRKAKEGYTFVNLTSNPKVDIKGFRTKSPISFAKELS